MKVKFYPILSHLRRPVAHRNSPIMAMKTRNTFRSKKLDFFENHNLIESSKFTRFAHLKKLDPTRI